MASSLSLNPRYCPVLFPIAVRQYSDKNNFKKKIFHLVYNSKLQFITVGKPVTELKCYSGRQSRAHRKGMVVLSALSPLSTVLYPEYGVTHPKAESPNISQYNQDNPLPNTCSLANRT